MAKRSVFGQTQEQLSESDEINDESSSDQRDLSKSVFDKDAQSMIDLNFQN